MKSVPGAVATGSDEQIDESYPVATAPGTDAVVVRTHGASILFQTGPFQTLQIEQRGNVWIRLPVVIPEQSFVIAGQAREDVRGDELIVPGESLGRGELESAIETLSAAEAKWRSGGTFTCEPVGCAGLIATRIEDEIVVAIIV